MLTVTDLWKHYAGKSVVAGISFTVNPGEIVGLLGPNGAGKSTTVSMICGLIPPDRGQATVAGAPVGEDAAAVKKRIGLVPQEICLYEQLPALGNVELFGRLYGLDGDILRQRTRAALELVGLYDRAKDKPATFSGGMKRRLNIACALVHDPDVLLFDEPTVGVDPQSRNAIFDNIERLRDEGKAIVYTSHYMEEVERLCERIVVMDHGTVVASDTLVGLHRLLPSARKHVEIQGEPDAESIAWLADRGLVVNVVDEAVSLETIFLHLTGKKLRD